MVVLCIDRCCCTTTTTTTTRTKEPEPLRALCTPQEPGPVPGRVLESAFELRLQPRNIGPSRLGPLRVHLIQIRLHLFINPQSVPLRAVHLSHLLLRDRGLDVKG